MLLDRIAQPADLRRLSSAQLEQLCGELRDAILDAVGVQGGHLGSNLGIVELTVALHRVFDSPHDVLLYDTGHQAYVHKMLTGRVHEFETLRATGGLSGYPSRSESDHDWIENSHASTALSYAHGLATAFETVEQNTRKIVAVIGDGSMTGGMAFEGLNNLGHAGSDVTIVLNDNGRSYAPTVSRLGESLARLRVNPKFVRQQNRLEKLISDVPVVGREVERAMDAAKAAVREMWEPTSFFENLGVRYTGPFDGHDIAGLEEAFSNAAKIAGPVVVHVVTQKGRGYAPAENDPVKKMHDTGPFKKPASPDPVAVPRGKYTAAFSEALVKVGERVPELVALTAAMPDSTGLLPFADRFPERAFDVGIAEQHAVTAAAGMAMGGLRPVVAIYSSFLTRAFDQIMLDVGLHELPVVFCVDRAGVTGPDGPSAHGVIDMMLLTKVPGMTMLAPSSYQEVQVMLDDAIDLATGPVAIRWPRTSARLVSEHEVGSGFAARRIKSGDTGGVCVLAVGKMVEVAEQAVQDLAAEGIDATLYDVRCIKPLDADMLADAASHDLVITIEDGLASGGVGSMISLRLADTETPPRVRVMGLPDSYLPHGDPEELLGHVGLDAAGIVAEVKRFS